jgi:hypothetical protein
MRAVIDVVFKLSIVAAILLVSSSVGYYYVVYLPSRDARLDEERRLDIARAEAEKRAEQERVLAEQRALEQRQTLEKVAAQVRYDACQNRATANYSASWATSCKRIADNNLKKRADCIKTASSDYMRSTCNDIWKVDPGPNCTLPRALGTDIEQEMVRAQDRCLQESKAGLQ